MSHSKHERRFHTPSETKHCFRVEHNQIHGEYTSHWGSGCPKCEDYIDPHRGMDPLVDSYRRRLSHRVSFYPALEDWAPCFDGGLVGVLITPPTPNPPPSWDKSAPGSCVVRVIDADDGSMSRECASLDEAREVVCSLPCLIAIDDLLSRGFTWG